MNEAERWAYIDEERERMNALDRKRKRKAILQSLLVVIAFVGLIIGAAIIDHLHDGPYIKETVVARCVEIK